jgi:hypothetical protein
MAGTQFPAIVGGIQTGVTAGATQTQAGATAITGAIATVTVVAADNDGVILPSDLSAQSRVVIANLDSAQDIKVYPPVGGTINGAAANAALVVGQQQAVECIQIGSTGLTWIAMLSSVATPA